MNKLLIIDGNNLAHRARHRFIKFSFQARSSSIVYGGPFIISSLLRRFPSDKCFVAFDGGRAKERMALLPGYKDRTKSMEYEVDQFEQQMQDFMDMLMHLNIRVTHKLGEEADDYIYSLSRIHRKIHKTIVSSDKDFIPMLDPYTKIFNPAKDKIITTENCKAVYNYTHREFLDYLILKGDKSDHIPGVTGLGEVRIRELLNKWGSIEGYLEAGFEGFDLGNFDKYFDDIQDAYDLNMELISLRYFHNKHRRSGVIPIECHGYNLPKVESITRRYGIGAFRKENFLKPFEKLGHARTNI